MAVDFKLPDLGEGIHEAEIISVKVKEGDTVKEDQPIFEVETDKAVVEIPSPHAGTIAKIMVKQGEMVTVGSVMISYDLAGQGNSAGADNASKTGSTTQAKTQPQIEHKVQPSNSKQQVATGSSRPATNIDRNRPVPFAPAIRKLARELGVDLYEVSASGKAGRVMREDVMAYAQGSLESKMHTQTTDDHIQKSARHPEVTQSASIQDKFGGSDKNEKGGPLYGGAANTANGARTNVVEYPDFAKYGKVERIPLKSIRRKIALNMTQAWQHIPHVTTFDEADVTELSALISRNEPDFAKRANDPRVRPTLTVFAIKAIASALKLYPQFNSSLDENTGEIVIKHYYNIGVAVATERGLIVPVIKDADQKSFFEIAQELADISAKTRAGKVELERLQGGTFTLTNIGAIGGTSMAPMVNFPECAIFGMARGAQKPVVRNGNIEIGTILPVAMSFDHRLADGAEAAYFVQHVVKLLQDPFKFILQ